MQQWRGRRSQWPRATSCRNVSTEIFRHRCLTCLVGQDGQLPVTSRRFAVTIVNSKLCHLLIVPWFVPLERRFFMTLLKKQTPVLTLVGPVYQQYRLGMKKYRWYSFCYQYFFVKASVIPIAVLQNIVDALSLLPALLILRPGLCLLNKLNLPCVEDKNES